MFSVFKSDETELPIFPVTVCVKAVVVRVPWLLPVVVIFPIKSEFKITFPVVLKLRVLVPADKSTDELKVTAVVVFTSTEPALTAPVKVALPFNLIFPSPISVVPETALFPWKIKLALYTVDDGVGTKFFVVEANIAIVASVL